MAARLSVFPAAFLLLVAAMTAVGQDAATKDAKKEVKKDSKTAKLAHFRLHGELDESPVLADPLFGSIGESFKTKIDRIAKAAKDPEIQGLVIHLDGVEGGWAKVQELRRAIELAQKAGKKVFAYLEEGSSRDYLIACAADRVAMGPQGTLMLVGMRAEITFFKELLERLGIRADFLTMGVFKAAAEPYTRKDMSPESKAQYKLIIDDYFENAYVGPIVRSRKKAGLETAGVLKLIDEAPHTASRSLKLGLIDHVAYPEEFRDLIKKDLGAEKLDIVKDYGMDKAKDLDLSNPFAIFKLLAPPKTTLSGKKDRIAVIYAVGAIMSGKSGRSFLGGSTVGSTTMIDAIRQADKDPKVKAIVLRVDSPGGSAVASDLIWNELKTCKKPVIASMSDTAASGGYYIAMGARKIYAEPGTLTGSIGVISGKIALRGFLEKVGVHTDGLSRGANSGLLSPFDPFSPSERKAMEAMMQEIYDQFLDKAIAGRKQAGKEFTREQMIGVAEGRIWTGKQALDNKLIDALGGLEDAMAEAKVLGGLSRDADVDYLVLPKPASFLDSLLEKGLGADARMLLEAQPELRDGLRAIEPLLSSRRENIWLLAPCTTRIR